MTSFLSALSHDLHLLRVPGIPDGDHCLWILASALLHTILFFLLPASPWLKKEGGEKSVNGSEAVLTSSATTTTTSSSKPKKPYNPRHHSIQIRNGLVSTFHATVVFIGVIIWHCTYTFELWNYRRNLSGGISLPGNTNGDDWYVRGTSFTLGYFIYDTICMAYYHSAIGNTASYLHHVAISLALIPGVFLGIGSPYHFIYLLEEMSTPALNFKNLYPRDSLPYKIWSILFVISFLAVRGIYGLLGGLTTYYCLFKYWMEQREVYSPLPRTQFYFDVIVTLMFVTFSISRVLNIYWMSLIAKYFRKDGKKKDKQMKEE